MIVREKQLLNINIYIYTCKCMHVCVGRKRETTGPIDTAGKPEPAPSQGEPAALEFGAQNWRTVRAVWTDGGGGGCKASSTKRHVRAAWSFERYEKPPLAKEVRNVAPQSVAFLCPSLFLELHAHIKNVEIWKNHKGVSCRIWPWARGILGPSVC